MKIDENILIRYFEGSATEVEKEQLHGWMEEDESNRKRFIREQIRFDASLLLSEKPMQRPERKRLYVMAAKALRIAASILLMVGCFYGYTSYQHNKLAEKFQTIYVPVGSRTNVRLPDGTSVWLSSKTTLRYPMEFSDGKREVTLDGEAFFEVTKDKKNPFVVRTNKYDIEVLGTSFNVEAYSEQSQFETILREGKVKLYNDTDSEPLYLSPGQTAYLSNGKLRVMQTRHENYSSWTKGLINIDNKNFSDILALFEKFYDVRIVVQKPIDYDLGYNGKFRIIDGVEHALKVLQNDYPFTFRRDVDKNIIYIEADKRQ